MYDYVTILFFYFSNKYNEGARINIGFTIPLSFFLSTSFFARIALEVVSGLTLGCVIDAF